MRLTARDKEYNIKNSLLRSCLQLHITHSKSAYHERVSVLYHAAQAAISRTRRVHITAPTGCQKQRGGTSPKELIPLRPLTKAQTTKKLKFLSHKEENSRNFILEFFRLFHFFVQNEPRLTVLSTVLASVRLVCTLSQRSVKLMTRFVISLRGTSPKELIPLRYSKKKTLAFFRFMRRCQFPLHAPSLC